MISSSDKFLDLRGTPCPLNYIRCCLILEELSPCDSIEVCLDMGEPEEMVVSGLESEGHNVEVLNEGNGWVRLMVICGAK